ncbi:MAG TPA: peptidase C1, partial [Thermoanaerobaculia bacterium]|nr:peptidase C1 [Thermoanaerobaculia bacterium]
DADGSDEIGVFRPATATFLLRFANAPGDPDLVVPYGNFGDLPVAGDWDGDGRDTIGVYRPADHRFYLRNFNSPGPPNLIAHYGSPGDVPVVGDWNGDGLDTIGVWRPSRASFFLKDTIATGVADYPEIRLGNGQDRPIVGNWAFP